MIEHRESREGRDQSLSAVSHFVGNNGFISLGKQPRGDWKNLIILNANVFLIDRSELGDCPSEVASLGWREGTLLQAAFSKYVDLRVQRIGAPVISFQRLESCQGGSHFCVPRLAQPREY